VPGLYRANAESGKRSRNAGGAPWPRSCERGAVRRRSSFAVILARADCTALVRRNRPACAAYGPQSPRRTRYPLAAARRFGSGQIRAAGLISITSRRHAALGHPPPGAPDLISDPAPGPMSRAALEAEGGTRARGPMSRAALDAEGGTHATGPLSRPEPDAGRCALARPRRPAAYVRPCRIRGMTSALGRSPALAPNPGAGAVPNRAFARGVAGNTAPLA
jgi:hypothetical protein